MHPLPVASEPRDDSGRSSTQSPRTMNGTTRTLPLTPTPICRHSRTVCHPLRDPRIFSRGEFCPPCLPRRSCRGDNPPRVRNSSGNNPQSPPTPYSPFPTSSFPMSRRVDSGTAGSAVGRESRVVGDKRPDPPPSSVFDVNSLSALSTGQELCPFRLNPRVECP